MSSRTWLFSCGDEFPRNDTSRDRFVELQSREKPMPFKSPKSGAPGTTEQSPRWEGPAETRPRGYMPAADDPDSDRDAVGENNRDPNREILADAAKTKGDR
jgi:hypothetical protein